MALAIQFQALLRAFCIPYKDH